MGRPRLPNPKNMLVGVRMTKAEKTKLSKAARKAGMSLSAYLMAPHRKARD